MMNVSDLPAVKDATLPNGIFSRAVRKPFIHPNVKLARSVLQDGVVPIDKVPFLQQARDLSTREYQNVQSAYDQITGRIVHNFERIFVVNTDSDYILTFGSFLIIDEDTIAGPYCAQVIAHELGHLNNGDSFVKAGLWFLGKGWMQETMSPFGIIKETPQESTEFWHDMWSAAGSAVNKNYLGAAVTLTSRAAKSVGSGVRSLGVDITKYFHAWDIEADSVAEQWVGVLEYQAFLRDLDQVVGRRPFDASYKLRRDSSENRQNPQLLLPPPAPARPEGGFSESDKKIMVYLVVGFIAVFMACTVFSLVLSFFAGVI